jgi:Protein of unknown function (DUF1579)
MKAMQAMGMTVAVVIVLSGRSWAEEPKSPPSPADLLKLLAEAGKPGPEHQKLQPLVGDWNFTLKLWTDPSQSPAELTGTVERKWIMDGRFVQETVKGQCAKTGKTFEGMGLIGYHNGEMKFTTVRACGLCGTISTSLTSCDASGTKFTCNTEECCPITGQKVKGRDELIIESNDKIVTNVFKTVNGKEVKAVEIVNTRKR